MKTFKLLLIGMILFFSHSLYSQVSVSVNIGTPPMWGPVGYTDVRYYYLPAVQAYYDINSEMFIYYSNNVWVHTIYLPSRYRNYDLYNGYKVVMVDYRGDTPYQYYNEHKKKYSKNYRGPSQKSIGNKQEHNNGGKQKSLVNNNGGKQKSQEHNNGGDQKSQGHENKGNGKGKKGH
jgi:hypothetical protein